MNKAPEQIETERLFLERPQRKDAQEIFTRYAADPEVVRYVSWPRHETVTDTEKFLTGTQLEWEEQSCGAYLIRSREKGILLGSTGLHLDTPYRAETGYVLAQDAWGKGYATEALRAMVELGKNLRLSRIQAFCHTLHRPSAQVLEKAGFLCEGSLHHYLVFPNLSKETPSDVLCYAQYFPEKGVEPI